MKPCPLSLTQSLRPTAHVPFVAVHIPLQGLELLQAVGGLKKASQLQRLDLSRSEDRLKFRRFMVRFLRSKTVQRRVLTEGLTFTWGAIDPQNDSVEDCSLSKLLGLSFELARDVQMFKRAQRNFNRANARAKAKLRPVSVVRGVLPGNLDE